MEYQKIIDLLENASNHYNDIRFKTTILKSGLFDYSNAYTIKIKITGVRANIAERQADGKVKT